MKNKIKFKKFQFQKKGIGIKNATRNQQPSTIEIKRIEKVKDQINLEQEGGCNYVDRTVILKHLQSLF